MIDDLLQRLRNSSDQRGKRILKHIAYSSGLKVVNTAVSFVVIPLYLHLLTEVSFGIWLTVSSVLNWFNFFDMGMGNGLRNRFAEALANGDPLLARKYVSTTYACLSIIGIAIIAIFFFADIFTDWALVFSAPETLSAEVNTMVRVLVVLFCPQFVVQLIKMIATADQRPALANLMNTTVNVLQLVLIWVLISKGLDSLDVLALGMGVINLLVPLTASILLFRNQYKAYIPSAQFVDFAYASDLLGLGFRFFILQGAALVVFMTDNLIITHVLGPEEVPAYNIAFRYFNIAAVFFGLITTPFWSAFTDAYSRGDVQWIQSMLRRLLKIWLIFSVGIIAMLLAAPWVYSIWLGDGIEIPLPLSICMATWMVASTGLSIYATFLSGVGTLRLSLYQAVVVMAINIPLSIVLAQVHWLGSAGVILATLICGLLRALFQPRQTYLILNGKARGIWAE